MKYLILLLILINLSSYSQIQFSKTPITIQRNDTTISSIEDTIVFDYFTQKFNNQFNIYTYSLIINYDSTLKYNKSFVQTSTLGNKSNNGLYCVYYLNHLLFKYETENNQVEGLGIINYLFEGTPRAKAVFHNGKLEGCAVIFNKQNEIESIHQYRKGKHIRCVYNSNAQLKASPDYLKKFKDPFLQEEFNKVQRY